MNNKIWTNNKSNGIFFIFKLIKILILNFSQKHQLSNVSKFYYINILQTMSSIIKDFEHVVLTDIKPPYFHLFLETILNTSYFPTLFFYVCLCD